MLGSITGVDVDPRYGLRSEHPIVLALNGVPNERSHTILPVVALIAYALASSVVTITLPPYTSGWA